MNKTDPAFSAPESRLRATRGGLLRSLWRALALALLCALLQALLPRYTLGTVALAPLSVVLGVVVAAAMARGRWTLPAALVGVLAGDLLAQTAPVAAGLATAVLGLQALVAGWMVRHAADPDLLQLDTWSRLRRFVLQAAPAAAAVGVVAALLAQWGWDAASALPLARPQLAGAVGRFVADTAGIIITAPVLLCWLAQPPAPWRPRRRQVALPLVLLVAVMLPGFDQVARRDETRLQSSFDRDAQARRQRIQQLLTDPLDAVLALRGAAAAGGDSLPTALFDGLSAGWIERVAGLQTSGWLERPAGAAGRVDGGGWLLRHRHGTAASGRALPGAGIGPDGRLQLAPALRQALDKAGSSDAPVILPISNPAGAAHSNPLAADAALLVLQSVPAAGTANQRVVFVVVDSGRLLSPALPDNDDLNLRVCVTDASAETRADSGTDIRTNIRTNTRTNTGTGTRAAAPADASQRATRLAGPPGCEDDAAATAVRRQLSRVALGERKLNLLITEPSTADNRLFTAVWLLALPAVLGAALLSALLLALTGRLRRIEDRVRERTVALQTEIDERRQTEAALAVSEQRFRAIFDAVSIGVTVVDPGGKLIEVNPAFCTMMGCAAADLLGRPLADFQLPDVHEEDGTAAALGGALARRQRYLTPDGRVLQVAANLRTLHNASGQPVATVGALQELTQVLRLREAEREREEAEIANRTKSEFLANLSHELRAPLNAIVGFAQMLGRDDSGQDNVDPLTQRHSLAQIRQTGWHLLDMVNDVLDLSRMEAGSLRLTLEPLSLADLVQEAVVMVEPAALAAGVALDLSLSPQADSAQADTLRLRQVLINLLGNAIKYNRPGGRVTVRTRPGAVGEVLLEVEDTGIGMTEAQIGELFTPFNRLGREHTGLPGSPGAQGTGIGLVICRKLSQLMGGELTVTSREAEGSVFSLRLQRPAGPAQRVRVSIAAPLTSGVVIGSVLYIEDSDADIDAMRSLLQKRPGISLLTARNAADGVALAHDIDLVLIDLDLPDRPGLDLLRELAASPRLRGTPLVVVSAESRPQRIDECFDAGAAHFLTKPLEPQQTLRVIDDSLG